MLVIAGRSNRARFAQALSGAAVVSALAVSGCGKGVPSGDVANVDGSGAISQATFNHWLGIAAAGQQPPGSKSKQIKVPKKGDPQYNTLRDQVMQFLISSEWIKGEAADRGIAASPRQVQKQFEQTKSQSFSNEKEYRKFLASSGMAQTDINFRVKLDLLSQEIRKKVVGPGAKKVSGNEVRNYYLDNKARFTQPERRDLRVVLNKDQSKVEKAKAELDAGADWKRVAMKYSTDEASKADGGKLPAVAKGQQEKALDGAVFKAKKGEVVGPVKTQFGYYVFTVERITPEVVQPLKQAKESIRSLVAAQKQQDALDSFVQDFRSKWKQRTACAKGFIIPDCDNTKPKAQRQPGQPPVISTKPIAPGTKGQRQGLPQGPRQPPPKPAAAGQLPGGVIPGGVPGGAPPQGAPPQGAPPQGAPPPQSGGPPPGQ